MGTPNVFSSSVETVAGVFILPKKQQSYLFELYDLWQFGMTAKSFIINVISLQDKLRKIINVYRATL